jgi:polar amino acid transport system substrate-binding protein
VVEILRTIFELEGFQVAYINLPWSHCIEDAREGRISALAGAHKAEVPDFIFPRQTIGLSQPTFFVGRDQTWQYRDMASLSSIRLGVIQDTFYTEALDDFVNEQLGTRGILSVKGKDSRRRLLEALREKHIDAFVENTPPMVKVLDVMGFDNTQVRTAGIIGSSRPLHVGFSPRRVDSEALAQIFDLAISKLRSQEGLAPILDQYGLQDWVATVPGIQKGN